MTFSRAVGAVAAGLWLIVLLGVVLACTVAPDAVNMVFGVGFWAVLATVMWVASRLP